MAECRRCGVEISDADIQKGRALQRGEFMYCPTCVAEARAAKSAAPATAGAPASRASAGGPASRAGASPASSRGVPGGLKPPPPSSKALKPAPASAVKKDKFADLIDDEGPAEEAPAPKSPGTQSVKPVSRSVKPVTGAVKPVSGAVKPLTGGHAKVPGGPASSKMRVPGGPSSSRLRKPVEEEPAASGSTRRAIGFKDTSGVGQTLSKQTLVMYAVGGGIFLVVAIVLFSTLVLGKFKADAAFKKKLEDCKAAQQDLDRVLREDPKNFEGAKDALKKFEEIAKGTKFEENVKDYNKTITTRVQHDVLKKSARELLSGIPASLGDAEGARGALTKVREALKKVAGVGWLSDAEHNEYFQDLERVMKSAKDKAVAAATAAPPDEIFIGRLYLVVNEAFKALPPDRIKEEERQALPRDIEQWVEKMYFAAGFLDTVAAKDLLSGATEWKADSWLTVSKSGTDVTLHYATAGEEKAGLYYVNELLGWRDYYLEVEFTADGPFQVLQRILPGAGPGATHDMEISLDKFWKKGEKATAGFFVYLGKCRGRMSETMGRPVPCAPTGAKTGGVGFRVPLNTKVILHKVTVRILEEEAVEAPTGK
jgi:hypothetical protein